MLLEIPHNTNAVALAEALHTIGLQVDPHQDPEGIIRTRIAAPTHQPEPPIRIRIPSLTTTRTLTA